MDDHHPKLRAPASNIKPQVLLVDVDQIQVGERHRRDLGDLDGLARSIAELGLLQPIVVTSKAILIAGERRLRAVQRLGWREIPVHVVDLDAVVRGEFAENAYQKGLTPSELVAITRAVEQRERELARERMTLGKISTGSAGRTRDKLAAPFGISGRTYEKMRAVVDAAEVEPERFGKLVVDMDRSGNANGPFKRLTVERQAEKIRREPPPLPGRGPYRVIVADPPWPYEPRSEDPTHRATYSYPTMSIEALCKLDVGSIAAPDSILWLWTINFHMRRAYDIAAAWGFVEVPTILTWVKPRTGFGDWLRGQTEHCLMCVRGKPIVSSNPPRTRLDAPVRGHSVKPVEFYDLVESHCPAPRYAELFSRRRHSDKWDCHGDQAPPLDDKPYDAADDFGKSYEQALDTVRARAAAGGPSWPHEPDDLDVPPVLRRTAP
jgi:N6-adenosine-specific RNA methylase IME4